MSFIVVREGDSFALLDLSGVSPGMLSYSKSLDIQALLSNFLPE